VTSLADLLFDSSEGTTDSDVVVHVADEQVTRAELVEHASAIQDTLVDHGIREGDPVAVMLENDARTVAALFGIWAAGAVYVPVNPRFTDREVARLLEAVPPRAVLTTPEHADRFSDCTVLETDTPGIRVLESPEPVAAFDADVALVQTTSGTTGPPRPVPLRHSQVLELLDGVLGTVRGKPTDGPRPTPMPNLVPVSLSLWAGIYNVLFAFRVGAPIVLMDRFDPRELARLVARYEIRSVVLPPAAMAMCCDDDAVASLAPLRYVRSITAPLSPFLARRFHDRFGIAVLNCYGQTELGGEVIGWSAADWREFGDTKLGAVGRPHAGVELRLDDASELWVRTPVSRASGITLGDRVDDGWVRTGDCAAIDDDGFVWIEGRVSDMVNRGGLKVFPAEVEEVLRSAPGVCDAAVVGTPDERLGEVPVGFVVGNVDAPALERHCREHLAPYKVPVRFEPIDELPRNEVGKVLVRELVDRAGAAQEPR
jgi:acyl-CoA synthetase (AMP-forming)/AMP-acid ligase II